MKIYDALSKLFYRTALVHATIDFSPGVLDIFTFVKLTIRYTESYLYLNPQDPKENLICSIEYILIYTYMYTHAYIETD